MYIGTTGLDHPGLGPVADPDLVLDLDQGPGLDQDLDLGLGLDPG